MRLRLAAAALGLVCLVLVTLFWPAGGQPPLTVETNDAVEPPAELVLAPPPDELPADGVGPGRGMLVQTASASETGSSIQPRVIPETGSTVKPRGRQAVPRLPPAPVKEAGSVVKAGVPVARPRIAVVPEAGSVMRKGGRAVPAPVVVRPGLRIALPAAPRVVAPPVVRSVVFGPGGMQVAAGGVDGQIQIYDVAGKRLVRSIAWQPVNDLVYAPDGTLIATGGNLIALFDPVTGDVVRTINPQNVAMRSIALTANGDWLFAGCDNGQVLKIAMSTGEFSSLGEHGALVMAVAISPNGRFAASAGNDLTVRLWNLETPGPPRIFTGHAATPRLLAFSPDGRRLASCGLDSRILLWDLHAEHDPPLEKRISNAQDATGLVFDSRGKQLLFGGARRFINAVDLKNGALAPLISDTVDTADGSIRDLALSPDGQTLAAVNSTGLVHLLQLDPVTSAVTQRTTLPAPGPSVRHPGPADAQPVLPPPTGVF